MSYPGQEYFHEHNKNIREAEEEFERKLPFLEALILLRPRRNKMSDNVSVSASSTQRPSDYRMRRGNAGTLAGGPVEDQDYHKAAVQPLNGQEGPPIKKSMERIEMLAQDINASSKKLERYLYPVLHPTGPQQGSTEGNAAPEPEKPGMVRALENLAGILSEASDRLHDITNRIAL